MAITHRISTLTTTEATAGGTCIQLCMLDANGESISIELPAQLASSLLLTLPHLMENCLRQARGENARLVFPVDTWELEAAVAADAFILKFRTVDGYSTSFAVAAADARALAEALGTHSNSYTPAIDSRCLN